MKSERMLIREHFNSDGKPKRRYPTRDAAISSAYGSNGDLREYKCGFCGDWHLGTWKESK